MRHIEDLRKLLSARRPVAAAVVVTVAAGLVAGCGSGAATVGTATSGTAGACGAPLPSTAPGAAKGGVRITAAGPACAEYEVTNAGSVPSDVTAVFTVLSAAGGALDTVTQTVPAVAPGATVKGRIDLGRIGSAWPAGADPAARPGSGSGSGPGVKVTKVRSVPSAEAPQPAGPCPASGLRLYADDGDAAMGLRVMGLHLRNCGTSTVTVNGYPKLQLLDPEHRPIEGVRFLSGGAEIAAGTGADNPPQEIALKPGEGARSALVWRNTAQDGEPINATYARVRAFPDAAPVMIIPELDLGTTGRLGIGAWTREDGRP
ncbi:DUF4232 domain-containing protein [Kitasatospora sp. NPDC127111]|uniref:DUF4232 domain-containing protein n=1 Tax=Kitasatospora sp. NPDC127111 TaxID=3345363 RepID=UPI0036412FE6